MFNKKERRELLNTLESKLEVLQSNVILMEHDFNEIQNGGKDVYQKDYEYRKECIRKAMIDTNILITKLKEL